MKEYFDSFEMGGHNKTDYKYSSIGFFTRMKGEVSKWWHKTCRQVKYRGQKDVDVFHSFLNVPTLTTIRIIWTQFNCHFFNLWKIIIILRFWLIRKKVVICYENGIFRSYTSRNLKLEYLSLGLIGCYRTFDHLVIIMITQFNLLFYRLCSLMLCLWF